MWEPGAQREPGQEPLREPLAEERTSCQGKAGHLCSMRWDPDFGEYGMLKRVQRPQKSKIRALGFSGHLVEGDKK